MPVHALSAGETASGDKYVEVQIRAPGTPTGTDAWGEPTYDDVVRMYLDEVPGPIGWTPSKIQDAKDLFQSRLPDWLYLHQVAENQGKANLGFTISRSPVPPTTTPDTPI